MIFLPVLTGKTLKVTPGIVAFVGLWEVMLQSFLMRHLSWCITGTDDTSVLRAFLEVGKIWGYLKNMEILVSGRYYLKGIHP